MGFGDVTYNVPTKTAIAALTRDLEAQGWNVTAVRYRLVEPSLPPEPFMACSITARRGHGLGELTALYGFRLTRNSTGRACTGRKGRPCQAGRRRSSRCPPGRSRKPAAERGNRVSVDFPRLFPRRRISVA
jgi:hypothetical protein